LSRSPSRRFWHPVIVPIPIVAVLGTLISDLAFAISGGAFWTGCSLVLARTAALGGVVAAAFGFCDFLRRIEVRRSGFGFVHFYAAIGVVSGTIWNLAVRGDGESISPAAIGVSLLDVAILAVAALAGLKLRAV
jgi:uncharacterized membrane protein